MAGSTMDEIAKRLPCVRLAYTPRSLAAVYLSL